VLVATGTGLAPFKAIISSGVIPNPLTLYYGVKTEKDLPFREFLQDQKQVVLKIAYSRGEKPLHVQDLLREDLDRLQKEFKAEGAGIVICGSNKFCKDIDQLML
jgi:sulfite reductase alpha subunit-like flavoprotein